MKTDKKREMTSDMRFDIHLRTGYTPEKHRENWTKIGLQPLEAGKRPFLLYLRERPACLQAGSSRERAASGIHPGHFLRPGFLYCTLEADDSSMEFDKWGVFSPHNSMPRPSSAFSVHLPRVGGPGARPRHLSGSRHGNLFYGGPLAALR